MEGEFAIRVASEVVDHNKDPMANFLEEEEGSNQHLQVVASCKGAADNNYRHHNKDLLVADSNSFHKLEVDAKTHHLGN